MYTVLTPLGSFVAYEICIRAVAWGVFKLLLIWTISIPFVTDVVIEARSSVVGEVKVFVT